MAHSTDTEIAEPETAYRDFSNIGRILYNSAGCVTNITYTGSGYSENIGLNWDSKYQLTAVSTNGSECERNGWDPLGRRAWNWDGSTTNFFVYDGGNLIAEVDSTGTLKKAYVYGPAGVLAMTTYGASTNTYYMLTDHMGTVHAVANEAGAIVESYRYDAWGRILGIYDGNNQPLTQSAIGNRFLFHGCEYSWKANIYLNGSRWYDPVTGRFLSKDPSGIVNGPNEYEYCDSNPVNFIDPDGESAVEAYDYWTGYAANGYNRGGIGGWCQAQVGNTMGMFIDFWSAREIETGAAISGYYSSSDECKGQSWKAGSLTVAMIGLQAIPGGGKAGGRFIANQGANKAWKQFTVIP